MKIGMATLQRYPVDKKFCRKSLYLAWFLRYKHFCVWNFCEKFENSKWPPVLVRQKFFENWDGTLQRYAGGKNFHRNRFISHGFQEFCVFLIWKIHND